MKKTTSKPKAKKKTEHTAKKATPAKGGARPAKKKPAASVVKKKGLTAKQAAPKKKSAPIAKKPKPATKPTPSKATPKPISTPVVPPHPVEARPGADKLSAEITESPSGQSFVITVNNYRNFFSLDEMRIIVRLCQDAVDEADGMRKLHQWFSSLRRDVINNTQITGPADTALASVYRAVRSSYTVKR